MVAETFNSIISLFLASNSFFAGSSTSALFFASAGLEGSLSFSSEDAGSVAYHLVAAGLANEAL